MMVYFFILFFKELWKEHCSSATLVRVQAVLGYWRSTRNRNTEILFTSSGMLMIIISFYNSITLRSIRFQLVLVELICCTTNFLIMFNDGWSRYLIRGLLPISYLMLLLWSHYVIAWCLIVGINLLCVHVVFQVRIASMVNCTAALPISCLFLLNHSMLYVWLLPVSPPKALWELNEQEMLITPAVFHVCLLMSCHGCVSRADGNKITSMHMKTKKQTKTISCVSLQSGLERNQLQPTFQTILCIRLWYKQNLYITVKTFFSFN